MVTPIGNDQIRRLWEHLSTQFNVVVTSIGTGMDSKKQRRAVVGIDENTDDAVIQALPTQFEGDNVVYEKHGPASPYSW